MSLDVTFTHVIAVPGELSIIDYIDPMTGRTSIRGLTLAEIQAERPAAMLVSWESWRTSIAALQDRPVRWSTTTREQYHDMLEILPPVDWDGRAFMVGEPEDHSYSTGRPRYRAYRYLGAYDDQPRFEVSDRPMTRAEFRILKARR